MTTDTDFHQLERLRQKYKPATRGILSENETRLIKTELELKTRNNIELQNIRDASVLLYGQLMQNETDAGTIMGLADAMSGITAVIDQEKFNRGMDV